MANPETYVLFLVIYKLQDKILDLLFMIHHENRKASWNERSS